MTARNQRSSAEGALGNHEKRIGILEAVPPPVMWPMSYDLLPRNIDASALDGAGGSFTTTVDLTYWTGFYWDNGGDASVAYMYVRLGPQGSEWGLNIAAERNTNCGILLFEWASVPEVSGGAGYDLDGLGMIPGSTEPDFPATFYSTAGVNAIDLYGTADKNKLWAGYYSQFRIMGANGVPITANATFDAGDNIDHFNGGSGIWCLKMTVDGKNALSSAYRTPITFLRLSRMTSDGFPTS